MTAARQSQRILDRIAEMPAGTWRQCGACRGTFHRERLARSHWSCPECGWLFGLSAVERIRLLADAGSFRETNPGLMSADPLEFDDGTPYTRRLERARSASGLADAVLTGTARIGGHRTVLVVMDFRFMGGSMGAVVGEKVARAADAARELGVPLVTVATSGGARMQEGTVSLVQLAKTSAAIRALRDAGLAHVSVLADPVYGGVMASFATLGDVIVAEAGARAGFAGPRVIEQTIHQALPKGFQTSEFLLDHGQVDRLARREQLRPLLARLLAFFAAARPGADAIELPTAPRPAPATDRRESAWETVRRVRSPQRPTALDYAERIFSGFEPLHGDRCFEDDLAVIGGLAWLDAQPVMVVGHCRGSTPRDSYARNFGMAHPSGFRKAMRLLAMAERLGIPVVSIVDTPGAYPGVEAEQHNQSAAIAESLAQRAGLRVPLVTLITGEGGSGGALALAVGDRLLMQSYAVLSVISPEGCAAILFGDHSHREDAAEALHLRALDLAKLGIADEVVPEPDGGAQADPAAAAAMLGAALRRHLVELLRRKPDELVSERQSRIRRYGEEHVVKPEAADAGLVLEVEAVV